MLSLMSPSYVIISCPPLCTMSPVCHETRQICYNGITYRADGELSPTGYVDSDFAECKDTHHSIEGNIFIVAGGPVSWESKRQETIALSTVEAEYMGFSRAATQALWISKYLSKIELPTLRPIMIHADNNGSISHSLNNKNHWRTKHIDVRHHFVKDQVKWGNITFQYIPSSNNIADLFTKPFP